MHMAVRESNAAALATLCDAPGAPASMSALTALTGDPELQVYVANGPTYSGGDSQLALAIRLGRSECVAVLRAHGATC